jgi:hypothetical protein
MQYDYARRYSPVMRNRQRVVNRHYGRATTVGRTREVAGLVLLSLAAVLLATSVWCGVQIKMDQDALLLEQAQARSLETVHRQLLEQRDGLADRKRIEKVAAKALGLFPPGREQVVKL